MLMLSFLILIIVRPENVFSCKDIKKMIAYLLILFPEVDWIDTANRARHENNVENFNVCEKTASQ